MKIEITQEQHQSLVDLLNEVVTLYGHEVAALLAQPAALPLGLERLEQFRKASELFAVVTRY